MLESDGVNDLKLNFEEEPVFTLPCLTKEDLLVPLGD